MIVINLRLNKNTKSKFMKKSTNILYLALLLGILIGSCTPCDDGDPEYDTVELQKTHLDTSVN